MKTNKSNKYNEYGLTEKQELFCQLYVGKHKGNATKAYVEAYNYKEATPTATANASRLINSNTKVKDRIVLLRKENEEKGIMTATELQEYLTKLILDEVEEEVIIIEGIGEGRSLARTAKKKASFKDKNKAIETLLKVKGAFLNNDNTINITPIVVVGDSSLED